MKVNAWTCAPATDRDLDCWDLKDGACSTRTVKSGETLVDARGDTDVQIVRYARFWDERQTEPSGLLEDSARNCGAFKFETWNLNHFFESLLPLGEKWQAGKK